MSKRTVYKLITTVGAIVVLLINTFAKNNTPAPVASVNESQTATTTTTYEVVKVIDGDTLSVNINGIVEKVRMIGVDTPETVDPRKTVQCFGKEASNKTKELLTSQRVILGSDITQGDTDKYGRLLRYVYLADNTFINLFLIQQGYAHEYTYNKPYRYQAEFKAAQKDAELNKRGLWSDSACMK